MIFDFRPDILSGKCRKWPFFEVFGDFLKNACIVFADFLICCSPDRYATAEKKSGVRENSGSEVIASGKCPENEPSVRRRY